MRNRGSLQRGKGHMINLIKVLILLMAVPITLLAQVYTTGELSEIVKQYYTSKVENYWEDLKIKSYRDMIYYKGDPTYMRNYHHSCTFDRETRKKFSGFMYIKGDVTEEFNINSDGSITIDLVVFYDIPEELERLSIDDLPGVPGYGNISWRLPSYCPSCEKATYNNESIRYKAYKFFTLWFENDVLKFIRIENVKSWKQRYDREVRRADSIRAVQQAVDDSIRAADWQEILRMDSIRAVDDSIRAAKELREEHQRLENQRIEDSLRAAEELRAERYRLENQRIIDSIKASPAYKRQQFIKDSTRIEELNLKIRTGSIQQHNRMVKLKSLDKSVISQQKKLDSINVILAQHRQRVLDSLNAVALRQRQPEKAFSGKIFVAIGGFTIFLTTFLSLVVNSSR